MAVLFVAGVVVNKVFLNGRLVLAEGTDGSLNGLH